MAPKDEQAACYLGVDFGGTKILSGVFNYDLDCLGVSKVSTKAHRGTGAVIERIARAVREALDEADVDPRRVRGVGVGAPGAVNGEEGRVIFAPNLEWRDVPLREELQQQLGLPVWVENDCNVATLGVFHAELKARPRHVLGIFLGTGIGGGLILHGHLHAGFNHTAGEIGHMVLDLNGPKCGCGNRGCFEALASRSAIFKRVKAAVNDGEKTILTDMLGRDLKDMRSGDLRKAVRRGDELVGRLIHQAAEYTGIAVANLANVLGPEIVVLGGGLIEALGDEMLPTITETANDYAMAGVMRGVELMASKLADAAGITGGAVLARSAAA